MKNPLPEAIFKTLAYADIFDYPLKKEEIWRRLVSEHRFKVGFRELKKEISRLSLVDYSRDYYFFKGRGNIVSLRLKREGWSREKLKKAERVIHILKLIPTIKMAGLTGNLAVENCDENDDIDLLIITASGTLWLTRFFTTLFLDILGRRRRPGQKEFRDKFCLNMFLDEDHLGIPQGEQDLYTAHEVVQMKPLWDRSGVYQKFLAQNRWIKRYLPNGVDTKILRYYDAKKKKEKSLSILISQSLNIFEQLAKQLQLWYMRRRRTTEVVSEGVIRFHPHDVRNWILPEFKKRLQKLVSTTAPLTSK